MKPNKRTGREARTRRQESAKERFNPEHKAQRWTCGHKHGEFIFASRCGMDNAPVEDRQPRKKSKK